jgi:hypothetical protein
MNERSALEHKMQKKLMDGISSAMMKGRVFGVRRKGKLRATRANSRLSRLVGISYEIIKALLIDNGGGIVSV